MRTISSVAAQVFVTIVLCVKVSATSVDEFKCRNFTFNPDEYQIQNDSFKTIYSDKYFTSNFSKTHQKDENLTFCLPFTTHFKKCIKWILHIQEVNLTSNVLYSPIHDKSYFPGEYDIVRNSVIVCVFKVSRLPFYYIDLVYSTAGILSALSLFVTLIVIYNLPLGIQDKRPVMCHMICFFVWFLLFDIYMLAPVQRGLFCQVIATVGPYSLRSAFCWLNVVMIDMWRRFSSENILKKCKSHGSWKIFILQNLYAWGMPCLIIGVSKLFPVIPLYNKPFASSRCDLGVYTEQLKMIFLGVTTGLSQVVNVVLAILTMINLQKIGEETLRANPHISQQLLSVNIKLLAVTGASWCLGFVEWAIVPFDKSPSKFWVIADVLYALQGFVLFCIYFSSTFVQKQIRKKLCCVIK